jgi:hypothetical protein
MRLLCAALLSLAACSNVITCNTQTADVGDVCLPTAFAPSIAPLIEIRELCGRGCSGTPSCVALFVNSQVVLDVSQDVCTDSQTASCIDLGCQQRTMSCQLPALSAGTYVLQVPGGPARLLRVSAGGQSSCRFSAVDGGVQ